MRYALLVALIQYEVMLGLKELWTARTDPFYSAPILEFQAFDTFDGIFRVIEGSHEIEASGERKLFDWILCPYNGECQGIRPELLFDDLNFFNAVFPSRGMKDKWAAQPVTVVSQLALASPINIDTSDNRTTVVTVAMYRSSLFKLVKGQQFRLFRRYIDFNLPKILRNFLEIDVLSRDGSKTFFQSMLADPRGIGHAKIGNENFVKEELRLFRLYRQLRELGNADAVKLIFQPSQRQAMLSILTRQLTIIHGPPGTGKTHTLALSALYLLEILYLHSSENVVVWMTAVTNAAIAMFLSKLNFLRERIRAIPHLSHAWLDQLTVENVTSAYKPPLPKGRLTIIAGTVWQLWTWADGKPCTADMLIIDEAGQMNVGTAALAIRRLKASGRLVGASAGRLI
jgi:AAA domain